MILPKAVLVTFCIIPHGQQSIYCGYSRDSLTEQAWQATFTQAICSNAALNLQLHDTNHYHALTITTNKASSLPNMQNSNVLYQWLSNY